MQAIQLIQPGGIDKLTMAEVEPRNPGPGEICVRNHASSLNFHDYAVVIGLIAVDDKRIPMSDGAGAWVYRHAEGIQLRAGGHLALCGADRLAGIDGRGTG